MRVLEADERAQLRALCARTSQSAEREWGVSERAWACREGFYLGGAP